MIDMKIYSATIGAALLLLLCGCTALDTEEAKSPLAIRSNDGLTFSATLSAGPATKSDYNTYQFNTPQGSTVKVESFMRPMAGGTMSFDPGEDTATKAAPVENMYDAFSFYASPLPVSVASLSSNGKYVSPEYGFADLAAESQFVCWAPTGAPGITFNEGTGLISYVTPTDVTDQKDFVVAVSEPVAPETVSEIPLTFKHTLAGVQVDAASIFPNCTVNSVTLKNVYGSGTYNPVNGAWAIDEGSVTDIELLPSAVTGVGPDAGIAVGDYTGMLVPQAFTADTKLEINLTFQGTAFDYAVSLDGVSVGKGVMFTLSSDGRSMFLFEGTASGEFTAGGVTVTPDASGNFSALIPYGTYTLQEITELTSVTRVPDWFLVRTSLNNIFYGCTNLVSVTNMRQKMSASNQGMFRGCTSLETIQFVETPDHFDSRFCEDCRKLTSIDLPETMTTIGSEAFLNCMSLAVDVNLPNLESIGTRAFLNSGIVRVSNLGGITSLPRSSNGEGVFQDCKSLQSVVLPDDFATFGSRTFYNDSKLASINFPETIKTIGSEAFQNCMALAVDVNLPNLESIGTQAFLNSGIVRVSNLGSITSLPNSGNGQGIFQDCKSLQSVVLPDDFATFGSRTFYNDSKLASINFPETIKTIGTEAFNGCAALAVDVNLPNLESIGTRAFMNSGIVRVSNLGSITSLPSSGTGQGVFQSCKSLETVILPDDLANIYAAAFLSDSHLTEVHILRTTPPALASNAFSGVASSIKYYIPIGSLADYEAASVWSSFVGKFVEE